MSSPFSTSCCVGASNANGQQTDFKVSKHRKELLQVASLQLFEVGYYRGTWDIIPNSSILPKLVSSSTASRSKPTCSAVLQTTQSSASGKFIAAFLSTRRFCSQGRAEPKSQRIGKVLQKAAPVNLWPGSHLGSATLCFMIPSHMN